jgi:hypothetical protein
MPAPVPLPLRQRIFQGLERGLSPAVLARQFHLPERTVRALAARFRAGADALHPSYRHPAPAMLTPLLQQALLLHEQHPTWGAPYLLLRLRQLHPERTDFPSARTLQRWFRRQQQPPAPAGRKPAAADTVARRPHALWQMDAVEQLPLQTGEQVSWLRWVDELSGAVLGTVVFPPRPLRPSAPARCPKGAAAAVPPLGPAGLLAGRQRRALGELQRSAHALRAVGGGRRCALALE